MIETSRRSFITGLVSFVAAPAIVRAGSLMPVKVMPVLTTEQIIQQALEAIGRNFPEEFQMRFDGLTMWRSTWATEMLEFRSIPAEEFYR